MSSNAPIYQAAVDAVAKIRAANPDIARGVHQAATHELRQRCIDQLMLLAWTDGATVATVQAQEILKGPGLAKQAL